MGGVFRSLKKKIWDSNVVDDRLITSKGTQLSFFLQKLNPQLKTFLNCVIICNWAISYKSI